MKFDGEGRLSEGPFFRVEVGKVDAVCAGADEYWLGVDGEGGEEEGGEYFHEFASFQGEVASDQ